jgi:hypothetical protein
VAAAAAALLQLRLLEVFFFLPAPQLWASCHAQLLQLCCRQLLGGGGSRVRPGACVVSTGCSVTPRVLFFNTRPTHSRLLTQALPGTPHPTHTACRLCVQCCGQQPEAHAEQPGRAAGALAAWAGHAGGRVAHVCGCVVWCGAVSRVVVCGCGAQGGLHGACCQLWCGCPRAGAGRACIVPSPGH